MKNAVAYYNIKLIPPQKKFYGTGPWSEDLPEDTVNGLQGVHGISVVGLVVVAILLVQA